VLNLSNTHSTLTYVSSSVASASFFLPSSSAKQATADAELENDLFGFESVDTVTSAPPTVPQVNVRYYAVYARGRRPRQLSPELRRGVYCCEWPDLARLLPGGSSFGSGVGLKCAVDLESAIALFCSEAGLVDKEPFARSSAPVFSLSDVEALVSASTTPAIQA
jgi:hypothetical protein